MPWATESSKLVGAAFAVLMNVVGWPEEFVLLTMRGICGPVLATPLPDCNSTRSPCKPGLTPVLTKATVELSVVFTLLATDLMVAFAGTVTLVANPLRLIFKTSPDRGGMLVTVCSQLPSRNKST